MTPHLDDPNRYGPADVRCPQCGETVHVNAGPTRRCEIMHCNRWMVVDLVNEASGVVGG